jgi:hypothetical protein
MDNKTNPREEIESYQRPDEEFRRRAEDIVGKLIRLTHILFRRGYGLAQLIFSDHSFVSTTNADLIGGVVNLIRAGQRPLGCVACACDRDGYPFTISWRKSDEDVLEELAELANYLFRHDAP